MPRPIRFSEDAVVEARAAFRWYRHRSVRAAARFRDELDQAVEAIVASPEAWPTYLHGTRRCLLRRFPFQVVFRVTLEAIEIVAVAHGRRSPGYWRNR